MVWIIMTILTILPSCLFAYGPPEYLPDGNHPRIYLTGANLSTIRDKSSNNTQDFQDLIAWCDAHINDTGYDVGDVNWNNGYRMSKYSTYLLNYALGYQILKESNQSKATTYAAFVRNILINGIAIGLKVGEENNGLKALRCGETTDRTINSDEGVALGVTTASYKLGYSARNLGAVPIAFDWIHDTLSTDDKNILVPMMLRWYDWIRGVRSTYNNGVLYGGIRYHEDRNGDCTGINNCTSSTDSATKGYRYTMMSNNFMGGYVYMMALIPAAVYGDIDTSAYTADFKSLLTNTIVDQIENDLKHSGGDSVEGWNYGGGFVYSLQGLYGYYTATGDATITAMGWPIQLVDAMAHRIEGNLLNVPIYGEWTGVPLGENRQYLALTLAGILQKLHPTSDLSGIVQTLLDTVTYSSNSVPQLWEKVLWYDQSFTPKALSTLPLSYVAVGNGFVTSRSSWNNAPDSVHASIRLEGKWSESHEGYDEGHLSLSRGADRLLVHANMQNASNMHNTIVFNGTSHHAMNPTMTAPAISRREEGASYFYASGDITNAWKRQYNDDRASLFKRSMLHIRPNVFVVYDVTRSNPAVGNLKDYYTQYEVAPVVNGNTISATVGSSKVLVNTLYPLGGAYATDSPTTGYYRVKYTPATTQEYDQFLHVIEATASAASQTSATAIDGTGGRGVVIGGNTVAMFTSDQTGANITTLSYSVDTTAASNHYIADLTPGATYNVIIDGGTATQYTASDAGLIVFTNPNHSPHTYSIVLDGQAVITGSCGSSNGLALSSAPVSGLCAAGTPSAVSGTGPWAWTCAGSGGGSTASCSATLLENISSKVARVKYGTNGKITGILK